MREDEEGWELSRQLPRLIEALDRLSADAESQRRWLNSFGLPGEAYVSDELAEELHDGALLLDSFLELRFVTTEFATAVLDIDRMFEDLSGPGPVDDSFWLVSSLRSDARWQGIREAARAALLLHR